MGELSSTERDSIDRAAAEPMLDQVLTWAAVNSGSRNLVGLEKMADLLADAFAALRARFASKHLRRSKPSMRAAEPCKSNTAAISI